MITNETFKVRSLVTCKKYLEYQAVLQYDPVWRQCIIGCHVMQLLQSIFKFNITYLENEHSNSTIYDIQEPIIAFENDSADIYIRPMRLQSSLLDNAYPIEAIFTWRFGFILRRGYNGLLRPFYSQPFTLAVWVCMYCIIILAGTIFYFLSVWDKRLNGTVESNFGLELLLAFSAYCQHILPLQAETLSRRTAYLTFIMGAYVVHCFYTSNLLSHLVHDKNDVMDLSSLANSDYKVALLKDMNLISDKKKYEAAMDKNLSIVWKKVLQLTVMDVSTALRAVMDSKTALLTDYITLYPILKRHFEIDEICQLIEIELYSNIKYYFLTKKHFKYKEEFKIGTLRAKEAGLLKRMLTAERYSPFKCDQSINHFNAQFDHTVSIIIMLLASYLLVILILIAERIYYNRNMVWPYVN